MTEPTRIEQHAALRQLIPGVHCPVCGHLLLLHERIEGRDDDERAFRDRVGLPCVTVVCTAGSNDPDGTPWGSVCGCVYGEDG
jgi:hypothetical protein